jgi:hypothetical protein
VVVVPVAPVKVIVGGVAFWQTVVEPVTVAVGRVVIAIVIVVGDAQVGNDVAETEGVNV